MTLLITLTVADIDTGPFNLYSNVDLYEYPFAELIEKSVLLAGYTSTVVPDGTTSIKVQSVNELCTNFILLTVDATTSTTSTTSTSTSTTTTTNPCPNCINGTEIPIGTQTWTGCNLDVVTYRDGTPIPQVTDPTQWQNLTTGAWCYYDNDPTNDATYGKMYNWYAVAGIDGSGTPRILAPVGYHVPSDAEFTTLTTYLGGTSLAGGKMKETGFCHWQIPNEGATNISGFTGLPAGDRNSNGSFNNIGSLGFWWSSSERDTTTAWPRNLSYNIGSVYRNYDSKADGMSVRLIKD